MVPWKQVEWAASWSLLISMILYVILDWLKLSTDNQNIFNVICACSMTLASLLDLWSSELELRQDLVPTVKRPAHDAAVIPPDVPHIKPSGSSHHSNPHRRASHSSLRVPGSPSRSSSRSSMLRHVEHLGVVVASTVSTTMDLTRRLYYALTFTRATQIANVVCSLLFVVAAVLYYQLGTYRRFRDAAFVESVAMFGFLVQGLCEYHVARKERSGQKCVDLEDPSWWTTTGDTLANAFYFVSALQIVAVLEGQSGECELDAPYTDSGDCFFDTSDIFLDDNWLTARILAVNADYIYVTTAVIQLVEWYVARRSERRKQKRARSRAQLAAGGASSTAVAAVTASASAVPSAELVVPALVVFPISPTAGTTRSTFSEPAAEMCGTKRSASGNDSSNGSRSGTSGVGSGADKDLLDQIGLTFSIPAVNAGLEADIEKNRVVVGESDGE